MENKYPISFAIIGAGYAGTTTLDKLLNEINSQKFHNAAAITIMMIEKTETYGPGLPYDPEQNGIATINVHANSLSINNDNPLHFITWLGKKDRFSKFRE